MELIWIRSSGKHTNWRKIMAYSKKVVDKFENTLKILKNSTLEDLIQKMETLGQGWLELLHAEM